MIEAEGAMYELGWTKGRIVLPSSAIKERWLGPLAGGAGRSASCAVAAVVVVAVVVAVEELSVQRRRSGACRRRRIAPLIFGAVRRMTTVPDRGGLGALTRTDWLIKR